MPQNIDQNDLRSGTSVTVTGQEHSEKCDQAVRAMTQRCKGKGLGGIGEFGRNELSIV